MNTKLLKSLPLCIFTVLILLALFPQRTSAFTIIKKEDLAIDVSLIRDDTNFNLQKRIVIVPIFSNFASGSLNDKNFYRGIFYYSVEKLGFNDIPFHYIVSEKGNVFEGNKGGEERRVRIGGIGDDLIVVGYMTRKNAIKFDSKSITALTDLLVQIANKNAIKTDKILVSGIKFVRNTATKTVVIEKEDLFGTWKTDLNRIKKVVDEKYRPTSKRYSVEIKNLALPKSQVTPGETINIKVTVANTSNYGLYGSTDSEIIFSKKDGGVSKFFLNNAWISTSEIAVMQEDSVLLPGQTASFEFNIRAPLFIGEIAETFIVKNLSGQSISSKEIGIKLNMKRPSKQIVEIQNTPTGALNVRDSASSVGNVISQVSPGERFFLVEDAQNGWIAIQLADGSKGWIARWYVNFI